MARGAVGETSEAPSRVHRLAEGGQVDDADERAVLVLDRQQVRVQRHAVGERLGAVDRIDDPAPAAASLEHTLLLTDHRVVGMELGEALADQAFGAAVGLGDGGPVALRVDGEIARPEPAQRQVAGLPDQLDRLVEQRRVGGGSGHELQVAQVPMRSRRWWSTA